MVGWRRKVPTECFKHFLEKTRKDVSEPINVAFHVFCASSNRLWKRYRVAAKKAESTRAPRWRCRARLLTGVCVCVCPCVLGSDLTSTGNFPESSYLWVLLTGQGLHFLISFFVFVCVALYTGFGFYLASYFRGKETAWLGESRHPYPMSLVGHLFLIFERQISVIKKNSLPKHIMCVFMCFGKANTPHLPPFHMK